jgi:RimJ/RimL family protein N-acetyltransferase
LDRRTLLTDRLRLEPIDLADAERLAVLHADARVMDLLRHGVLTRAQSDALIADYATEWKTLGFGSWTATERETGELVGLGGLRVHEGDLGVALRAAFTPEAQGRGYGPELGRAAVTFAFDVVGLDRVVAITRPDNIAGQRSLEKFGMNREREFIGESGRVLLLYAIVNPRPSASR